MEKTKCQSKKSIIPILAAAMCLLFVPGATLPALAQETGFQEFQSLPTQGASDWMFFTIGNSHYLAVANALNDESSAINSVIYKWNGAAFTEFDTIATKYATDCEFFDIGENSYLAVTNLQDAVAKTYEVDMKIHKWNGARFEEFQSIPTSGGNGCEHFAIGNDSYLAVANFIADPEDLNIDSKIYKWSGSQFAEFQSVPTHGATSWQHFAMGSDHYLAVSNALDGTTHNIASVIYKWNGGQFVQFQSITTSGISDWEHFVIDDTHYLAAANWRGNTTFAVDSKIYEWNGSRFEEFQSVPTQGANDWEFFTVGNDHYLALASTRNDSVFGVSSFIYKWDGTKFAEYQSIDSQGAYDWEFFEIDGNHYLALANRQDGPSESGTFSIDSKIYKLISNPPLVEDQSFSVDENSPAGTVVGTVIASDPDQSTLSYAITGGDTGDLFVMDGGTGEISLASGAQLDYESGARSYELTVEVSDGLHSDTATVSISVADVNEAPSVSGGTFSVSENSANGTSVGSLSASDPESGSLSFSITGGNPGGAFAISSSGQLTVGGSLNYESVPAYTLTVRVSDGVNSATASVQVGITDVNEAPSVSGGTFSVSENSANGTPVGTVFGSDPESASLSFSIVSGNTGNAFAIGTGGQITVADGGKLDYEGAKSHTLGIQASDGALSASATVTVSILNVNEGPSISEQTFSVDENRPNGTVIGEILAADPESDSLICTIRDGNTNHAFALDSGTRELSVNNAAALDFEANPGPYTLTVEVSDGTLSDSAVITVNVGNVNEKPVADDQTFAVDENSPNGTPVGTLEATDPESDGITFVIESGNSNKAFAIDSVTGAISVSDGTKLNFEVAATYSFVVQVSDGNLSDLAAVTVSVRDVAESPVMEEQNFSVQENSTDGTVLGDVSASDPNGDPLTFEILEGNAEGIFAISESGELSVAKGSLLDYENTSVHMLTVRASDGMYVDATIITIDVGNENEEPVVNAQSFGVDEDSGEGTLVGAVVAVDLESDALTYEIISGNDDGVFAIAGETGDITVSRGDLLDHESKDSHALMVRVSDGTKSTDASVTVNVLNVALPGDLDDNFVLELRDAILGFQVIVGANPGNVHKDADTDGDGRIGVGDVAYVLKAISQR